MSPTMSDESQSFFWWCTSVTDAGFFRHVRVCYLHPIFGAHGCHSCVYEGKQSPGTSVWSLQKNCCRVCREANPFLPCDFCAESVLLSLIPVWWFRNVSNYLRFWNLPHCIRPLQSLQSFCSQRMSPVGDEFWRSQADDEALAAEAGNARTWDDLSTWRIEILDVSYFGLWGFLVICFGLFIYCYTGYTVHCVYYLIPFWSFLILFGPIASIVSIQSSQS